MGKKVKNPIHKLSYADKDILNKAVFVYAVKFYTLTQQYPDPRKYVENFVVKKGLDHRIATVGTIAYAKNAPSNYSFRPGEINQRLANDLFVIQENCNDMLVEQSDGNHKRFMHPRDLREKVLKHLEYNGIFLHLEGNEVIKNYEREKRHPGRPSIEGETDRGGKRSLYITTEEVENLKKTFNKSGALDFLRDKIIESGLALKLAKYLILCSLYTIKTNVQAAQKLMGIGESFSQLGSQLGLTKEEEFSTISTFHKRIQAMDNNQLEKAANKLAKKAIEEKGYYTFLFLAGFLKP